MGDDALIIHHDINLGIAVDLDNEGLIVPVVHNAEELNLRGMARRIRDVADRARNKRLSLDDISGGTFSITNAGPFGTFITGAIINQPQVAILSTDGVARKPVVVELPDGTESITIHSVGLVAMTFDHRAVDGAYVARFLARLSEILNDRDWAGDAVRPNVVARDRDLLVRSPMRSPMVGIAPCPLSGGVGRCSACHEQPLGSEDDYLLLLEHPARLHPGLGTPGRRPCAGQIRRRSGADMIEGRTGVVMSPITGVPVSWSGTR